MFISSILYPPENLTAAPRAIPCPEVSGAEVGLSITMMSDHDEDTMLNKPPVPYDKGRANNRSILQFCLAFSHQWVNLSSVKRFEAIK